ncbi:insect cuticle protein domain-containing protein [Phthorimaea operculella]|nr:insect cuticle protein domain-containing protein [Phthorimaea operculella]
MVRVSRLLAVVAAAFFTVCRPATAALGTQINKLVYNYNGLDGYSFEYETSDGTYRKEDGGIVSNSLEDEGFVVRGEYGYIDPTGLWHVMRYIADKNGYQPQYDHVDTSLEDEGFVVRGEYGYIDPTGLWHVMRYIADKNGYQPQYDHVDIRFNDRRIV